MAVAFPGRDTSLQFRGQPSDHSTPPTPGGSCASAPRPTSYVLSGSARAEFVNRQGTRLFQFADNGYQRQWMALHAAVVGDGDPLVSLDEVVDDITYALELADQVDALLGAPA
jgi:hypothetical protein